MDFPHGVTLLLLGMIATILFFLLFFYIETPEKAKEKDNTVLDDFLKRDN